MRAKSHYESERVLDIRSNSYERASKGFIGSVFQKGSHECVSNAADQNSAVSNSAELTVQRS